MKNGGGMKTWVMGVEDMSNRKCTPTYDNSYSYL